MASYNDNPYAAYQEPPRYTPYQQQQQQQQQPLLPQPAMQGGALNPNPYSSAAGYNNGAGYVPVSPGAPYGGPNGPPRRYGGGEDIDTMLLILGLLTCCVCAPIGFFTSTYLFGAKKDQLTPNQRAVAMVLFLWACCSTVIILLYVFLVILIGILQASQM